MYLFQVKTPAESKDPYDYYKLVATIPADRGLPAADRGRLPAGEVSAERARRRRMRCTRSSAFPTPVLFGQLLLGLINGAFYALLSLGLAVIFGLLNIVNFSHGALYMLGAFAGWMLLTYARPRLLVGAAPGAAHRRRRSAWCSSGC